MGKIDRNRSSVDFSMPGGAGDKMYVTVAKETLAFGESHQKQVLPRQDLDPLRNGSTYVRDDDIDRAKPKPLYPYCGNREKVEDDPKMHPRKIPEPMKSRPMFSLKADDVPGAQPTATHILKPRDTNPLDPHYKLPHKDADPVVVPKFIRDSIDISDIEGARSKIWNADPPVAWSSKTLQLDATDIEGAQVGWRPFHRKHIGVVTNDTTLNVADINRKPNIQTRPPPPEVEKAWPAPARDLRQPPEHCNMTLKTGDVALAHPRQWITTDFLLPTEVPRRVYRPLCYSADIPGAVAARSTAEKLDDQRVRARLAHELAVAGSDQQRQLEAVRPLTDRADLPTLRAVHAELAKGGRDGSGLITVPELARTLRSSGLNADPSAVAASVAPAFVRDGSGYVSGISLRETIVRAASAPRASAVGRPASRDGGSRLGERREADGAPEAGLAAGTPRTPAEMRAAAGPPPRTAPAATTGTGAMTPRSQLGAATPRSATARAATPRPAEAAAAPQAPPSRAGSARPAPLQVIPLDVAARTEEETAVVAALESIRPATVPSALPPSRGGVRVPTPRPDWPSAPAASVVAEAVGAVMSATPAVPVRRPSPAASRLSAAGSAVAAAAAPSGPAADAAPAALDVPGGPLSAVRELPTPAPTPAPAPAPAPAPIPSVSPARAATEPPWARDPPADMSPERRAELQRLRSSTRDALWNSGRSPTKFISAGIARGELVASQERYGRRQYERWEDGAGRLVKRAPPAPEEPPLRWKPTHEADFVKRTGGWTRVGIDKEPGQTSPSRDMSVVSPPWGTFHFVPGMDWDRPDLPPDHLARSMMALQRAATASATVRTRPAAELPTKSPRSAYLNTLSGKEFVGGPLVHSGHLNKTSPRPLGTNNASAVSVGAANAPPQASPAVRPMTTGGQMTTSPGVMQRMANFRGVHPSVIARRQQRVAADYAREVASVRMLN